MSQETACLPSAPFQRRSGSEDCCSGKRRHICYSLGARPSPAWAWEPRAGRKEMTVRVALISAPSFIKTLRSTRKPHHLHVYDINSQRYKPNSTARRPIHSLPYSEGATRRQGPSDTPGGETGTLTKHLRYRTPVLSFAHVLRIQESYY